VGSVGYGDLQNHTWKTFATQNGGPSAFSRTGPSLWNVIKPRSPSTAAMTFEVTRETILKQELRWPVRARSW
jgi:hypothetical protein